MSGSGSSYRADKFNLKYFLLFLLIAFGWTWLWWSLFVTGTLTMPEGTGTPQFDLRDSGPVMLIVLISPFGPTIAGFAVTALSEGKQGVRKLWNRFIHGGFSWKWWLILLSFYAVLRLVMRYSSQFFFNVAQPDYTYIKTPWMMIPPILASILHGGLSEEFGWRGYALRHLQAMFPAAISALILGFIEGCWHIPLVFLPGDMRFGMTLFSLIYPYLAVGIFRAWIYNNTNGSVLAAVMFHMTGNIVSEIIPINIPFRQYHDMIHILAALFIFKCFGNQDLKINGEKGHNIN